jgi:hypothetical protein
MIKTQQDDYNWQIIFLGMGADSWGQGSRLGVNTVLAGANTGASHGSTQSVVSTYAADYRIGTAPDMSRAKRMTVNAAGKVYDAEGDEIDPATGKKIER